MNQLDAEVTKIISRKPKFAYDKYWLKVEYTCYGLHSTTYLMFDSEQEAMNIQVGYKFVV